MSRSGFVAASHFIPASKPSGSSDPTTCDFSKHHFILSSVKWGIKANMERVIPNQIRFTYPLIITDVEAGSEADDQGIKKGDQIVAALHEQRGCHRVKVNLGTFPRSLKCGSSALRCFPLRMKIGINTCILCFFDAKANRTTARKSPRTDYALTRSCQASSCKAALVG